MTPYVIRQGDHMPRLAAKMKFDADAVWNHPKNASLHALRGDMHILCAGDVLYVPEPAPPKWTKVKVGATNRAETVVPHLTLRFTFANGGKPLASEPCRIRELPALGSLATDGNGALTFKAPTSVEALTVEFPGSRLVHTVHVGHLDPVSEESGVSQRLRNLGYLIGTPSGDDEKALRAAVAAFQSDQGNTNASGELDDATRDQLKAAHGC